MNKNKFNNDNNSSQTSSLEANRLKQMTQVKSSDELVLLDKIMTDKPVELDNPSFVLGYN